MDWRRVVGTNINRLRVAKGLTQEEAAFRAKIDLTYWGGIERGRRNPSLLVLVRIAETLSTRPADLLKERTR
jgi:transcriptional regulator with XRE-family HTH domain